MRRALWLVPLALYACGDATGTAADLTISGTITLPDSLAGVVVIIGDLGGNAIVTDGDDLIEGFDGSLQTPRALVGPISVPGGSASRAYSFTLPADPGTFRWLVAFADLNGNGKFDFATETARLPKKTISGGTVVVDWASSSFGQSGTYYVNGATLDAVGRTGFDFKF